MYNFRKERVSSAAENGFIFRFTKKWKPTIKGVIYEGDLYFHFPLVGRLMLQAVISGNSRV